MSNMVTGKMNKSARGMKIFLSRTRGFMIMPMFRKPCKAPDKIGPPLAYMEECGVFKPLDTMANPLGLCQFYCTNPETLKSISPPKSLASIHRVKHLLEKAKGHGQPYIISHI